MSSVTQSASQSASQSQSQSNSQSNSQSGSNSGSQSGSASGNATRSVSIPATAAAGGITITQPPSTAQASYYKIAEHEFITFGWNLTSLYVQPQSLTVIASCAANGNTYPVGPTNGTRNTISGNATQVVWNPWQWEQSPGATPFAVATYVLKVWDERGPTATVRGGYLSPYAGGQFAMYRPQGYTPLSDWKCTTCSSALSTLHEPAGIAIFTTLMISLFTMWNILRR